MPADIEVVVHRSGLVGFKSSKNVIWLIRLSSYAVEHFNVAELNFGHELWTSDVVTKEGRYVSFQTVDCILILSTHC